MNQLAVLLVWCWAQVFVISAIAIALSWLTMRRSPATSAAICWSGILAALVITLLAPISVSHFMPGLADYAPLHHGRAGPRLAAPDVPAGTAIAGGAAGESVISPRFTSGMAVLHKLARATQPREAADRSSGRFATVLISAVAVASAVCLARLISGIWAIRQIARSCRPVNNDRIAEVLDNIHSCFSPCSLPEIQESDAVENAAVIGWFRAAIILPADWRQWSQPELRAVMAHEWAHIARRDIRSRLVAAITVALQCSQPLLYWLRGQLILAQELAADEMASAALGSRADYLRAVAQLALRQDGRLGMNPNQTLVPVFSGFLMRRIEMLRATDCSRRGVPRRLVHWTAVGLLVAIAAGTTALCGLAEPPVGKNDDAPRVATATKRVDKPAAEANDAHPDDPTFFQHKPFDIASLAMGKRGAIVVRLGELLKQPRFAGVAREQNKSLAELLNAFFPEVERSMFSLENIDWIACDFLLSARFVPDKHPEHPHEVMFGTGCVFVRWNKEVGGIFDSLRKLPEATKRKHGDIEYVELPLIPAMGPVKCCVARLDEYTLVWGGGESVLTKRLDKLAAPAETQPWHAAWKSADGGLVTVVAADPEFKNPSGATLDESGRWTEEFFAKAPLIALGADWHGDAESPVVAKFQLPFSTEADARFMHGQIEHMLEMAVGEVSKEAEKATDVKAKQEEEIRLALLNRARTEIRKTADGYQLEINIAGPLDIESLFKD